VVERVLIDRPIGEDPAITGLLAGLAAPHLRPQQVATGQVHLVGAGPGDPGLITVKGLALLRQADVVIHDRLIPPALLAEARADAEVISVGKAPNQPSPKQEEINALLVRHAQAGHTVVRLKGGDPFVFGRGSEELDACREAGIGCEVVSGVSSAIAVPAAAGIPVTERGVARSFAVVTGHTKEGAGVSETEIAALARLDTLVLLMGRAGLGPFTAALIAAGRDPATPAAAIERGTTPAQRVVRATLADIAAAVEREGLEAPMITVIGQVASGAVRC
jgi:uroporphyrin-III C-methyltransferase